MVFVPLAAALLVAGPAAAQSSHASHHPAGEPTATAVSADKGCPRMNEIAPNLEQMKQMHQQMMGQMAEMMQMMQQHQGMAMPKSTPPPDAKPH